MTAPPHKLLCPSNFIFKFADAPWSQECQKLLLVWDKLGEQYESHKDIMIAKIDVTANDLSVGLDRYPFFTLFPAGADFQVRSSWGRLWGHSCTQGRGLCLHVSQGERSLFTKKVWSFSAQHWFLSRHCCQEPELEEKPFCCLILYMGLWQELRYHLLTWITSP